MIPVNFIVIAVCVAVLGVAVYILLERYVLNKKCTPGRPDSDPLVRLYVTDADGEPLEAAEVWVNGAQCGSTDSSGIWQGYRKAKEQNFEVRAVNSRADDPPAFQPGYLTLHPPDAQPPAILNETLALQGFSLIGSWKKLAVSVQALKNGPQTVTFTYSFIPPGTYVTEEDKAMEIIDHTDGSLDSASFRSEIQAAFAEWKATLEAAFQPAAGYAHPLRVEFQQVNETGSVHIFGRYNVGDGGTGDIRIGMFSMAADSSVLAYAYGPDTKGDGDVNRGNYFSDMLFNAQVDWRKDADVQDGAVGDGGFSVKFVAAHELGHALGLGHNACRGSLMFPSAGLLHSFNTMFPGGLSASVHELAALRALYPV